MTFETLKEKMGWGVEIQKRLLTLDEILTILYKNIIEFIDSNVREMTQGAILGRLGIQIFSKDIFLVSISLIFVPFFRQQSNFIICQVFLLQ